MGRRVRATAGLDAIRLEVDLAWDGPNTCARGHSDSDALSDAFYVADLQGFHGFEPVFACLWSAIDPELTSRDAEWVEELLHRNLGHAYPHVVATSTRVADRTDGLTTLHALLDDTTSSVAKNAILNAIRTLQGDRSDAGGLSIVESAGGELAVADDDERRRLAQAEAQRQRTQGR